MKAIDTATDAITVAITAAIKAAALIAADRAANAVERTALDREIDPALAAEAIESTREAAVAPALRGIAAAISEIANAEDPESALAELDFQPAADDAALRYAAERSAVIRRFHPLKEGVRKRSPRRAE